MKHPAAESATNASDDTPVEKSAGEKHSADPTKADSEEAAGISPSKETPVMSPVATVRLFAPKPSMNEEVEVLESAASWAELGSPSSLIDEQVPIFEPEQAAEVSQKVSYTEEDEPMLPSEASLMDIGYNNSALMECEKASVTEPVGPPPHKDREYYLESVQGGTELNEGTMKKEDDHDSSHEADSDEAARYEIVMTGGPVEAACDEVAEEAIDSSEEDVEAACSGDPDAVSESEFCVAIDAKRRGGRRRKRGRPSSKMQGNRLPSLKKQDEEVCFICFDGGDLVLCDRRGCPKVYHPSCVNREESYFQSKGQWSCGWHICSKCQKSASYMCYTCTYSLCKVCIDEADFNCIRGKKGFCPSCMSTILLMETSETADEQDGVDFNDRSCWEYLFKDYWLELKGKLSMSMNEITKAKTASKVCNFDNGNEESSDHGQGASSDRSSACHAESLSLKKKLELARNTSCETSRKEVQIEGMSPPEGASTKIMKKNSRNATVDNLIKEGKVDGSTVHQETSLTIKGKKRSRKTINEEATTNDTCIEACVRKKKSSRKKMNKRSRRAAEENSLGDADTELTTAAEDFNWASMELLAFVSHVKNGDRSILSQYDVQELLLDYIKANNLRDPRKRSQIICDKMLLSLFHKPRVGHFEMLKLLESHFLINVSSPTSDENQLSDMDPIEMSNETSNDLVLDKRKTLWRKNCELKASFYEYAAIDAYNINLMYLRRSLMEDLIDDMSTFNEKVIGSFVRIRVTASNQRQEVYRLVQVIGCGKAPEEYRTGKKATDVMLEIINLDKKEVITIDIISNQDFTEEECKRLRQSIKFGFISTFTVGEVQEKARVLLAVRISDHLESEKLRLIHLRDRASEKGKKREHRECVEKLQLLSSPEAQLKRLSEVPEAHADPKMDPNYDSPEDDKVEDATKEGNPIKSTINGRDLVSPLKDGTSNLGLVPKSSNSVTVMGRAKQCDDSQSIELNSTVAARANEIPSQIKDVEQKCNVEAKTVEPKACAVETLPDNKVPPKESVVQSELKSEILPAKIDSQYNLSETEKLWYYKDPSGKIQGPFSIVQLRKWSKHFPSNLGIWRKAEKQEDSVLLTDALAGNFKKDLPEWIPGDIKPVQHAKTNETTAVMNSPHLSSASLSTINSSKIQEVASLLSVPISQPSLLSHLAYQNSVPLNEKAVSGAMYTDLPAILGSKQITGCNDFNQISRFQHAVANVVHSETTQHQSVIIQSHGDPSNKLHDQPGTTPGQIILPGNGDLSERVSAPEALVTQKHDSTVPFNPVKLTDHSTSSTESNTMPEISPRDPADTRFRNNEAADVKPPVQANALETVSQGSDASTFRNPPPEAPQLAHPNSLKQIPGHHSVSSCNWNVSNDTKTGEQATPAINSATMPSESTAMVLPNGSTPFSTPQMNMIWGTGTPDANNPGWQAPPNQYQNMHSGMGPTNPGWGMMTQGNMNMPWGAPPNLNMAWGQCGFALPQQGNVPSGFVWGAPQGNMVPNDSCRPPAQVNGHQYPIWQGNPIPNPIWTAAPAAGINMNQNAWIPPPVQGNPGTNNAPGTTYDNQPKENPSGSSMLQKDIRFREQNVGLRNGSFRGSNGSGQSSVRQPRNWMGASSNNSEGPLRPQHPVEGNTTGICKFFENGCCRKGSSCNYFHS